MAYSSQPHMALVIDENASPSVGRCMTSAASGMPLVTGTSMNQALERLAGELRLIVVSGQHLPAAIAATRMYPTARIAVLAHAIDDGMLATALRTPQVLGFLAWRAIGVRPWELSYMVRRVVAPQQPAPSSSELLLWGGSSVVWHPRTSADRDQTVRAVELVAMRFGIGRRLAGAAADAAHELLMNAMYDAPVDHTGQPRYASDRRADVTLEEHEVPNLRLTVDSSHLSLDIEDPFGRLPRSKLFGGILRGRSGAVAERATSVLDVSAGGAGLGLFNLYNTAAVLRVEVVPGRRTLVSWMLDRTVNARSQRSMARSLYYIEGEES